MKKLSDFNLELFQKYKSQLESQNVKTRKKSKTFVSKEELGKNSTSSQVKNQPPMTTTIDAVGRDVLNQDKRKHQQMPIRGRGKGRGRVTSQPSRPPNPPNPSLHIPSSETRHVHTPSPQSETRPTPIISQPSHTSQTSPPSDTSPTSAPSPSRCQTRPTPITSPPLQTPPTSDPIYALSPHSQTGTSADISHDPSLSSHANPHTETSSLALENIRWGSKDVDGRIWIKSAPGNNFHPEFVVRGAITRIFKEKFEGAWTSWNNVHKDMLDAWFEDFESTYKWLEKDKHNIRKCFNSRGSLALKNALFKVRSGKDQGTWIGEDNLEQLKIQWQEEGWQKVSMTNKQNRQSQDGANVHSGGSISAREHVKKMRVELNREPTNYELYERLHRPKGKPNEWFNEKQAKIAEMYETQMVEKQLQSGEGSSQQSTQESANGIFLEVVGGINKKGRIFGLGSQAATVKASSKSFPSISTDSISAEQVTAMEAKIQALTAELQDKTHEQEALKQKMDQWEQMFARVNWKTLLIPAREDDNGNNEMGDDPLC